MAKEKLAEGQYTKEQLLSTKTGVEHDVMSTVLVDGETYSKAQADSLVSGYLKRKV